VGDGQDLATLDVHGQAAVGVVLGQQRVLAPGDEGTVARRALDAPAGAAADALGVVPLGDHAHGQGVRVELDLEPARADVVVAEAVDHGVVVEEGEAVRAGEARVVLEVELGGPGPEAGVRDVGEHVALPPHDPDDLAGEPVDEHDAAEVPVADDEVAVDGL
jgi:hypothetical protein